MKRRIWDTVSSSSNQVVVVGVALARAWWHRHGVGFSSTRNTLWVVRAALLSVCFVFDVRADPPEADPPDDHKTVVTHGRPGFTPKVGGLPLLLTRPRTAEEALELVPGVVVVQHGNEGKAHQLYLRGFDALHGSDFEVLLEGVRLNEHSNVHATGYFDLALVPVSLVRDITVDKGPFALDQGFFGTAGTARYRLGIPQGQRGYRVGYELGTTNRHALSFSVSPDDPLDEGMLGVELVTDHGFGPRRDVRRLAVAARVAPPPTGPDALSLFVALGLARFELPGLIADADVASGFVDFHGAYDDLSRGESDRVLAVLRHVHEGALHVATSLHVGWRGLLLRENFTGYSLDPERGDARLQTERRLHAGLASDAHLHVSDHLTFDAHAGFRWDSLTQAVENVDDLDHVFATERTLDADLFEAWLAPGLRFEDGPFSARLGARMTLADHRPVGGHDTLFAVLPRVDLSWRPSAWTLRLAYGRAARPPEARASTLSSDTNRPALTLSDAFEVGVRVRTDRLEASLAGFLTFVGHESVFDHASGQSLELDSSRRLGLELQLVYAPIDPLRLRLELTIADARYDRSGRAVAGVPHIIGALQAELVLSPWRFFLRTLAVGPRPLPHGATGAGLVDLSLGADWTSGPVRIGLTIDNALDLEQRAGVYHFASYWDPATARSSLARLSFAAGPPLSARLTLELTPGGSCPFYCSSRVAAKKPRATPCPCASTTHTSRR